MESLFINGKINEISLSSAYPNIKRISIQKISATLESIKDHPRKYELCQAMRSVFEEILEYYKINPKYIKSFKDLKKLMNKICDKFEKKCFKFEIDLITDIFTKRKISLNIAYISKVSGKKEEGFELFKRFWKLDKLCPLGSLDLQMIWWQCEEEAKFGGVGIIYKTLKDKGINIYK